MVSELSMAQDEKAEFEEKYKDAADLAEKYRLELEELTRLEADARNALQPLTEEHERLQAEHEELTARHASTSTELARALAKIKVLEVVQKQESVACGRTIHYDELHWPQPQPSLALSEDEKERTLNLSGADVKQADENDAVDQGADAAGADATPSPPRDSDLQADASPDQDANTLNDATDPQEKTDAKSST